MQDLFDNQPCTMPEVYVKLMEYQCRKQQMGNGFIAIRLLVQMMNYGLDWKK